MLEKIFKKQFEFGKKFTPFGKLNDLSKQVFTLNFIGHAIEELNEMRRELPLRKDWSKNKFNKVDNEKLLKEYIDVLHFFVTIALVNEWTAKQVYNAYMAKNKVNHERQKNNY